VSKLEKLIDENKEADRKRMMQIYELRRTLEDSQRELADVVRKYDQAVKDLESRESEQRELALTRLDASREIQNLQHLNVNFRENEEKLQRELNEVYTSLRRKEEVLKQMEQRLTSKIEERDKQNADLITKITAMEQTFNQKAHSIEILERTSTQLQFKERELTSQLDEKDREMTIYKQSVEN